jgi:hypothetical protein
MELWSNSNLKGHGWWPQGRLHCSQNFVQFAVLTWEVLSHWACRELCFCRAQRLRPYHVLSFFSVVTSCRPYLVKIYFDVLPSMLGSWDSVVSIVTRLRAGWCRFWYLLGKKIFLFSKYVQTSWGTHWPSCSADRAGCFPGHKGARAWSWAITCM